MLKTFYHTDGFFIAWAFYHADSFEFLPVAFINLTDGCLWFVFLFTERVREERIGLGFLKGDFFYFSIGIYEFGWRREEKEEVKQPRKKPSTATNNSEFNVDARKKI